VKQGSKLRRYRINSEKLANLLLDPDAGAQLRALAKMSPMTAGARRLSGAILVMGMPDDEQ